MWNLLLVAFGLISIGHGAIEHLENSVRCLDSTFRYKKLPRRNNRMLVHTQLAVFGIYSMDAANMELTGEFYLLQEWRDPRCQYMTLPGQNSLTLFQTPQGVSHPGLKNLWQPDTHVLNARTSSTLETVTHIWPAGQVV